MSHVTPAISECTEDDAGVILAQGLAKNQGADEPSWLGILKGWMTSLLNPIYETKRSYVKAL